MAGTELELRVAWQQHVGTGKQADEWFDSVLDRYRLPERHYHDVRHVAWVVRHVIALARAHPLADLDATVAAAFFHDAVYDPLADDNEAASARLAELALTEIGWAADRRSHVSAMVESTAGHAIDGADRDTCVLLAADLAVLASEPVRYTEYSNAVRREHSHVDDDGWRAGRAAVLRSLLDRPILFAPELDLDDWESRARANLTAELASL